MSMDVKEDLDEAGGYAFINLGQQPDRPFKKISIRRLDAEPRHLGVEDWQPEVAWLEPRSIQRQANSTVIRIGPEVVDRIEELVRVEIVAEGEHPLGVVTWPAITPSPSIEGSLSLQGPTKHRPHAVDDGPTKPAPATNLAGLKTDQVAPPGLHAPDLETTLPIKPGQRRRGVFWAVAALVVILGASGTIFLIMRQQAGLPNPPEAVRSPTPSARELADKLDAMLLGSAAPSDFLALGAEALAAGHPAVAFRAFEAADPHTNPDAALQLAKIYDPRGADERPRAALPNAPRAIAYYALWKNRSAPHTAELKALCSASANIVAGNDRLAAACRD
jgi:hypothetical protein